MYLRTYASVDEIIVLRVETAIAARVSVHVTELFLIHAPNLKTEKKKKHQ